MHLGRPPETLLETLSLLKNGGNREIRDEESRGREDSTAVARSISAAMIPSAGAGCKALRGGSLLLPSGRRRKQTTPVASSIRPLYVPLWQHQE